MPRFQGLMGRDEPNVTTVVGLAGSVVNIDPTLPGTGRHCRDSRVALEPLGGRLRRSNALERRRRYGLDRPSAAALTTTPVPASPGGTLDGVSLLLGVSGMIRGMTTLADELVTDKPWAIVEPLLPAPPRPPYGGRRRAVPDRNCLAAIVDMARTCTPWRLLPAGELGCGSPVTCWRRLTKWATAGGSISSTWRCWTGWAGKPAGLVAGQRGHHQRAGQAWGDHVGANPGRSWQAWKQAPPGL